MRQGLTIGETAKLLNMSTSQIRFYEKKGLLKPHRNQDSKYRLFSFEDIDRLEMIHAFRQLEIPISEIEELLSDDEDFDYVELVDKTINRISKQIKKLKRTKAMASRLKDHYEDFINSNSKIIHYPKRKIYVMDDQPLEARTEKELYDFVTYYNLDYNDYSNEIYTIQGHGINLLCVYNPNPKGRFDKLDTYIIDEGHYFSMNLAIPPNESQKLLYEKLVNTCETKGYTCTGPYLTIENLNKYSKNMIHITLEVKVSNPKRQTLDQLLIFFHVKRALHKV